MRANLVAAVLMTLCQVALSNDGVYWSSGGVLYPMKETRIALKREMLSFSCHDGWADVDVLFEFMNPENAARTLSIGFQAPAPGGDQPDSICSTPQISDLRVMSDGRLLPYRIMMAEHEDAPLVEVGAIRFTQESGGVFVYLFEMVFKPGMNVVQHSYRFRASGSVDMSRSFNYILRTGSKWAGGLIGDFTLDISFNGNERFFVRDVFGESASWSVVGVGRVGPNRLSIYDEGARAVRLVSGRLRITAKDLKPTANLDFHVQREGLFLDWPGADSPYRDEVFYALLGRTLDIGKNVSWDKAELRFMRNVLYAQQGYVFKDPALGSVFGQFDWYVPDPNLRMENINLPPQDRLFIEQIKLKEAE